MRRSVVAVLALPLAGSLLLAGCGADDPKPDAGSNATRATSPTTAPTPTAGAPSTSPTTSPADDPGIPAAARGRTDAGAEAFVRHVLTRLNAGWTKPEGGLVSPLCQPTATACRAYEATADQLVRDGQRYDGPPLTVTSVASLGSPKPTEKRILAEVVQEKRNVVDRAGKVVLTDAHKTLRMDFRLVWLGESWSTASVGLIK